MKLVVILLLICSAAAIAETTCPDMRAIEQTAQPVYLVNCNEGDVEITTGEFHSIAGQHGTFAQFCTTGPDNPNARGELRWQTASGLPEVCDVFTPDPRTNVRNAQIVYFVHHDLEEQEINTSQHTLVWNGNDLINFNPPVPGIIVE